MAVVLVFEEDVPRLIGGHAPQNINFEEKILYISWNVIGTCTAVNDIMCPWVTTMDMWKFILMDLVASMEGMV